MSVGDDEDEKEFDAIEANKYSKYNLFENRVEFFGFKTSPLLYCTLHAEQVMTRI